MAAAQYGEGEGGRSKGDGNNRNVNKDCVKTEASSFRLCCLFVFVVSSSNVVTTIVLGRGFGFIFVTLLTFLVPSCFLSTSQI